MDSFEKSGGSQPSPNYVQIKKDLDEANRLLGQCTSLTIMVVGKAGIGKSTVVNGLIGETVAPVDKPMVVQTSGVTTKVNKYEKYVSQYRITVYDTPGLFDPTIQKNVIDEIKALFSEVDILLICIDMSVTRLDPDSESSEIEMIRQIATSIGEDVWKKSMIVFLKANVVASAIADTTKDESNIKVIFNECLSKWKKIIIEGLKGIDQSYLTFAVAGVAKKLRILKDDKNTWLSQLWLEVGKKIQSSEAKAAFIAINKGRFTTKPITERDIKKELEQQLIEIPSEIAAIMGDENAVMGLVLLVSLINPVVGVLLGTAGMIGFLAKEIREAYMT